MSYATLASLKSAVGITDTTDDVLLQVALDAATSTIDEHCNRTFVAAGSATARTFTASSTTRVEVDDIFTTTGLVVSSYNTAVAAAVPYVSPGYEVGPVNAAALGRPYTYLTHTTGWSGGWAGYFTTTDGAITVTAKWGFASSVPKAIEQACLLQASRLFSRRHSPYGISGSPDMGGELRLLAKVDADVAVLLRPYIRMWGAR